jgi:N-acetylglucosamine-6-phosphate deacetylase
LAGLPPGRYDKSLSALEILPDGRLVIAGQDQLLAGASRPLGVGVAGVMRFAGVDLPTAIAMASTRPAEFVGFEPGGLMPGNPADLVVFDLASPTECAQEDQFQVRATIRAGEILYGKIAD